MVRVCTILIPTRVYKAVYTYKNVYQYWRAWISTQKTSTSTDVERCVPVCGGKHLPSLACLWPPRCCLHVASPRQRNAPTLDPVGAWGAQLAVEVVAAVQSSWPWCVASFGEGISACRPWVTGGSAYWRCLEGGLTFPRQPASCR